MGDTDAENDSVYVLLIGFLMYVTFDAEILLLGVKIVGHIPSLYNEGFNFTYEFHYIHTVLHNDNVIMV